MRRLLKRFTFNSDKVISKPLQFLETKGYEYVLERINNVYTKHTYSKGAVLIEIHMEYLKFEKIVVRRNNLIVIPDLFSKQGDTDSLKKYNLLIQEYLNHCELIYSNDKLWFNEILEEHIKIFAELLTIVIDELNSLSIILKE